MSDGVSAVIASKYSTLTKIPRPQIRSGIRGLTCHGRRTETRQLPGRADVAVCSGTAGTSITIVQGMPTVFGKQVLLPEA
jgi:hypothetical protein